MSNEEYKNAVMTAMETKILEYGSVTRFATVTGFTKQTISNWRYGKSLPRPAVAEKYLGIVCDEVDIEPERDLSFLNGSMTVDAFITVLSKLGYEIKIVEKGV